MLRVPERARARGLPHYHYQHVMPQICRGVGCTEAHTTANAVQMTHVVRDMRRKAQSSMTGANAVHSAHTSFVPSLLSSASSADSLSSVTSPTALNTCLILASATSLLSIVNQKVMPPEMIWKTNSK